MSTTWATFKATVLRILQDPSQVAFVDPYPLEFANAGIVALGRIAPARFREDITPIANTLDYQLQASVFSDATPEIEVIRVEQWDTTQSPPHYKYLFAAASNNEVSTSSAGWLVWNGSLMITEAQLMSIVVGTDILRVWGYRPYPTLDVPEDSGDVMPVSPELLDALRYYVQVEGIQQLTGNRALFTQWQTAANNSDVTPAALMNDLTIARQEWVRRAAALYVPREAPG